MNIKKNDIAIIGMAGRFPGAANVIQFWRNICEGKESIRVLSDEELKSAGVPLEDIQAGTYVKASPLLDDIDRFDPAFFKIAPVEAELMDPQIRLLLQCAWETLEDAGYAAQKPQHIGVFAGSGGIATSYFSHFINKNSNFERVTTSSSHLGNDKDFLSTYISYKLNLTGPSMTVQTACSTSMVALHQACVSLLNNECEMALAGGVSIRVPHVEGYHYKEGHLFSKSGHVRTFDEQADGVVFGSGLGLVLVKRLEQAIKDGDNIYAVIKGSAILNDGKGKMSYAASSARGQIKCIQNALQKADVDARTIGFVEAHGTGTFMGDPEEVKALSAAFKLHTDEKNFCVLGAVKTNVGHLDAASGITALIKTVLTLRHRVIPPTLHFQKPNPRIKFEKTPFWVNTALLEWESSAEPRRAGVNSLGVGGTNAFVILEEYLSENKAKASDTVSGSQPVIVPLSAKTAKSLHAYARELVDFISQEREKQEEIALNDLAYTLQVGRDSMDFRVAFAVDSLAALKKSITLYLDAKEDQSYSANHQGHHLLDEDADHDRPDDISDSTLKELVTAKQWTELARLWINGLDINWHMLHKQDTPRRISLPTYVFEKERYWVESGAIEPVASSMIHPLLHHNRSDLDQQRYSSLFSGNEFFLSDHVVKGQHVLPGVAYLEMACAAVENCIPPFPENVLLELRNVVWVQPIIVDEKKEVSIALAAYEGQGADNEYIEYEIYSHENEEEVVHCQGQALIVPRQVPASLDPEQLARRMTQGRYEAATLYPAFKNMGLAYGSAHQGIVNVLLGEGELLARLSLPQAVTEGSTQFLLHPSMMDSALQAALGLIADFDQLPDQPSIPFSLESLRVMAPCTGEMYAWARYAEGSSREDRLVKLNIDLCDLHGIICVQLSGFSSRMLHTATIPEKEQIQEFGSVLAVPGWEQKTVTRGTSGKYEHQLLLAGLPGIDADQLATLLPESHCVHLNVPNGDAAEQYTAYALECFSRIKEILEHKPRKEILVQLVIRNSGDEKLLSGLSGLLKSATLENPKLKGQLILTDTQAAAEELAALAGENRQSVEDAIIKYEQGRRYVQCWHEVEEQHHNSRIAFKDHGVYLITGGLGGLGILFTKEILAQADNATIILTGRSPLTKKRQAMLDTLPCKKGQVVYHQLDLTDPARVKATIETIIRERKQLNGIIHSAGMIADNFILKKTPEEFKNVLLPKVRGSYNLDQASKDCNLDFFILFSSTTSAFGNLGQADYAAANGFMDQFALYRNQLVAEHRRQGASLAINWPLWKEGGMGLDEASQRVLEHTIGLRPMRTSTGIAACYRSLELRHEHSLVMEGDLLRIRQVLFNEHDVSQALPMEAAPLAADTTVVIDNDSLLEKTEQYVRQQFSSVLKLPSYKIDPRAALEKYGIDSMLAMSLTNQLEKEFGPLSKTLLFEYQTIRELSEYIIASHYDRLTVLLPDLSGDVTCATTETSPAASSTVQAPASIIRRRLKRAPYHANNETSSSFVNDPVAIVGLSGRYPESPDLYTFWNNLRDGKDCIIEVPEDRWDWKEYFTEDRTQAGSHYSKWGGFIEGVDEFDPRFFNISPREAELIDPQERLFLQYAWMAVEDAGYTRASLQMPHDNDLAGQVGVYAGVMYNEYQLFGAEASLRGQRMGFASNPASIANRVSYVLNLHGPSMTIDTMCSSSLSAIHIACQDLKAGRTDLAIAGGVNVSIHPNKYLMLSAGQFISSDGHCQSFGEGGDGYIPGEGVGVVVLKRLSEAKRDGNHIYGIIKGTALNHGGKTNGYTVPNPQAQAAVIRRALRDAKINPRAVSYIEAHGTGTRLGDPIEIASLTQAFSSHTGDTGFCLLGSAKSNIGHTESAAGIAGLTKVLLQMKYRQIVPSLHSSRLNPHIDFEKTPFIVNQQLTDWDAPVMNGGPVLRTAGISSFGAGGSNAHLIVEEFPVATTDQSALQVVPGTHYIIPLSARTSEQLRQKTKDLLDYIQAREEERQSIDLPSLAYTLQKGREEMEERLGFVVVSITQLKDNMISYLKGEEVIEDFFQGQVKRSREGMDLISQDDDMIEAIEKWIRRKKFSKLLDLWVKGLELDWNKLYGEQKPSFMSLPAYPFAKEHYWIDAALREQRGTQDILHPLVHRNTSDFNQQSYTTLFNGKEFFLKDYQVEGDAMLPLIVLLEMARAAIQDAAGMADKETSLVFKQVEWTHPVVIGDTQEAFHISLFPEGNEQVQFEIYRKTGSDETQVHAQGMVELGNEEAEQVIDILSIRSRTRRGTLDASQCYHLFQGMNVEYGPGYRAIKEVWLGADELLANIELPSILADTSNEYGLHPSMLLSAVQAAFTLLLEEDASSNNGCPLSPLSLEVLEYHRPCVSEMYAWIRVSEGNSAENTAPEFLIDLCDREGNCSLSMRGITLVPLKRTRIDDRRERAVAFLRKEWSASPLPVAEMPVSNIMILHTDSTEHLAASIGKHYPDALLLRAADLAANEWNKEQVAFDSFIDLTGLDPVHTVDTSWVTLLQNIIEENRSRGCTLLYVTRGLESYINTTTTLEGAEKAGLYRMLHAEYPSIISRHLDLDPDLDDPDAQAALIAGEISVQSGEVESCYRKGERYISVLAETSLEINTSATAFADFQVLLVTGGTRGLGLVAARHMVTNYGVKRLVLTGREVVPPQNEWDQPERFSPSMQEKIRNIRELQALGAEVLTLPFPLDDLEELRQQHRVIQECLGNVSGIIHAAGLEDRDNPAFIRKSSESIARIMSPKVTGLHNLTRVIPTEKLQFMVLYSSVSALIPSLGTGLGDYAMANAFMDYYAMSHYQQFPVVSIQWPSWKDAGMGEVKSRAYRDAGLLGISNEEGLHFLDTLITNREHAVMMPLVIDRTVFDAQKLLEVHAAQKAGHTVERKSEASSQTALPVTEPDQALQQWLASLIESELKMNQGELDNETEFADYGVDSVLLAQILNRMNRDLSIEMDPSVFFEYTTLQSLAGWLQSAHAETIANRFSLTIPQAKDTAKRTSAKVLPLGETLRSLKPKTRFGSRLTRSTGEAVAVVGMSCRFPGANNLQEYWELLAHGRSAIAPVPEDCWGIQTDYHAALLEEIYGLDPRFFMVPEEDAQVMDPQALVLLEESLKALYYAGYTHQEINGNNIGVYIGARSQNQTSLAQLEHARNPIVAVGQNYLAANISQFFNFKGPSLVIDTACSSSLVGMQMAVEALRSGSIDAALVGGVSLLTSPMAHEIFARRNLHADNGAFHIFDRRASGVVLGEGCGMVYLKPLSKAKKDGDTIYAEIAGISINNDGRTAGPATPNIEAQKAVMRAALEQSGCSGEQVDYLEVNGSGSEVTDLLEIKGIASVYNGKEQAPLYLGSMKPNIGHPLCAEGIAGFIKVVLMLHHQSLVPFLSGQEPLQHFSMEEAGMAFPRKNEAALLRYAALNSFADGGTNAHVILKESFSGNYNGTRHALPLPVMERVDVRTLQPLSGKRLAHEFVASKIWTRHLTGDHPVLANHKVYDREVLPGLAWIDLLYQWFGEAGFSPEVLELKNLSIYRPLMVSSEKPVDLLIIAHETSGNGWRIQVSDSQGEHADHHDLLYITAEMYSADPVAFDESVVIKDVLAEAEKRVDLADVYRECREKELLHAGLMRAEGAVYSTSGETWIHVKLAEEALGNEADYCFHPALIDASGVGAFTLFSDRGASGDAQLFLPLFYESFTASSRLGNECYTRIRHDALAENEELQSFTMEFFTPEGNKIGALRNFKNKLVRHAGLINPERAQSQNMADAMVASRSRSGKPAAAEDAFDTMESMLQSIFASQLGMPKEEIDLDAGYYEMGLESAMLLQVVSAIERMLAVSLSPIVLFEYTNIRTLARYLETDFSLPGKVSEVDAADVSSPQETRTPKRRKSGSAKTTHTPLNSSYTADGAYAASMDIAVIGLSGRYPGASNLSEFWENLKLGKDCITEVPADRWDPRTLDGVKSPLGKEMSRWGGFIDNVDCFDPLFFNISPKEAEVLDPQERLFLEVCWETIEDAGYTPVNLVSPDGEHERRPVGVFVGVMNKDYMLLQNEAVYEGNPIPLSLNCAPIANRVSYFCNFHGPSMAIDTVCSSSLTAVHLAMESLKRGESRIALAGGVNLSLHPNKYQTYGLSDFHSSDGRCRTFGEGGDGYVSAEGVGAVLLKPLDRALEDGDHIYAVIKGSSLNHVGKVSGITVPSPVAQGALIADCLHKSGIDPESISYIEAHGTGTSLGDPIEIQGLKRAFASFTSKKQFCAIGSVKSNIGHSESAAGISGLTKTILQLHHRTLVKSLHAETINPLLELDDSPFYVQKTTAEWKLPVGPDAAPRRAGVSAFGATGSNAHIILEEFPRETDNASRHESNSVLLPLSAKNLERLQAYAEKMQLFLLENPETDLTALAYTLQTGRVAFEERLIMLASSCEEAAHKLGAWLAHEKNVPQFWHDNIKTSGGVSRIFDSDDDLQQAIRQLLAKKKFHKLAEFWVKGFEFDWNTLYSEGSPERTSLPTYPFARERYWVDRSHVNRAAALTAGTSWLHPLLHGNTSDLSRQRYTTLLSGREFFVRDHQVNGQRILPGVAYLEMARAAVEHAVPEAQKTGVLVLHNLVWVQPVVIADAKQVSMELSTQDGKNIEYRLYTNDNDNETLYFQGNALFQMSSPFPKLELEQMLSRMHTTAINAEDLYTAYQQMGIAHGHSLQGVQSIYLGENQLLAKLVLPSVVGGYQHEYYLHPSLMDSAFQSTLLLFTASHELPAQPLLPFSLESVRVIASCQEEMYAWVRYRKASAAEQVFTYDIDLCDLHGNICVRIEGLSSRLQQARPLEGTTALPQLTKQTLPVVRSFVPVWNPLSNDMVAAPSIPESDRVLLLGDRKDSLEWLRASYPDALSAACDPNAEGNAISDAIKGLAFDHLVWIAPDVPTRGDLPGTDTADMIAAQETGVLALFRVIKGLLQTEFSHKKLHWTIITSKTEQTTHDDMVNPTHAGISGLVGSLAKEYPHWEIRLLDIETLASVSAKTCLALRSEYQGEELAYRNGEWLYQGLAEIDELPEERPLYRKNGVYVVIGGAGGLGEVWSRFMIEHYQAEIIWIGRKQLDDAIAEKSRVLGMMGNAPVYISADATDVTSLENAYRKIKEKYPVVHGVIHSAIVLQDQSITRMEEETFRAGLSAKVDISVNMDRVFGSEDLDFMLFFSSVNSFIRGAGQSNYAAGCTFKDSFARMLQQQRPFSVKIMNWGYWGNVGIVADETYAARMERLGYGSIEPDEGMRALERLTGSGILQLALIKMFHYGPVAEIRVPEQISFYPGPGASFLPFSEKKAVFRYTKKLLSELAKGLPGPEIEGLVTSLLAAQLIAGGLLSGEQSDPALVGSAATYYTRWLTHSRQFLQQQGFLDEHCSLIKEVQEPAVLWDEWEEKKAEWLANPNLKARVVLMEACLKALPDVLSGKQPATDVMFPDSSMRMVEGIYKDNILSDHYNEVLGHTLVAYIQQKCSADKNATVRILEIGAGTGGTTARLLPLLEEYKESVVEYCYTDLSRAFLMFAEEHYQPGFPALTTALFDVSKPLASQSIKSNHYDIVIATNVLHATYTIRETVRNAKAVLHNRGMLLINEMSNWSLSNHVTFGLLEGWWLYEDTALRLSGCPGLTPETWRQLLQEEGFGPVRFPAEKAHDLGQQIIAAISNGVVRQRIEAKDVLPASPAAAVSEQSAANTGRVAEAATPVTARMAPADISDQPLSDHVRDVLRQCVADSLKMQPEMIERDRSFSDYGVDSIIAVQLINLINRELDILLQTTVLFDFSNLDQLSLHITAVHHASLRETLMKQQADESRIAISSAETNDQVITLNYANEKEGAQHYRSFTPAVSAPADISDQLLSDHVREVLRRCVADSLKMQPEMIERDRSFSDYGVDSIIAVQLINLINRELDILLQTTVLFDYSNLDQLSSHIAAAHSVSLRETLMKQQPEIRPQVASIASQEKRTQPVITTFKTRHLITPDTQPALQVERGSGLSYQRIVIERPGEIQDVTVRESGLEPLGPYQVCVAIRAFSLNFGDLLCIRGMYPTMPPYPFTPGYDASGIVMAVGSAVERVRVGDEVIVEAGEALGAHATAVICEQEQLTIKPGTMSFVDASSLPVVGITMIDAFHKANLQEGESILIQTAAGGTGLIAVQLASYYGATIYATAGSAHKLEYLRSLGVPYCINYIEQDFEAEIDRLTGGRGVDVVINTLSGDAIQKGINCLAPGGRYIEIAMTALKSAKSIDISTLSSNQSFYSIDIRKLGFENPDTLERYRKELLSFYQQGIIRPTICKTFSFEDIQQAYQALSERSNIGKIVVTIPEALQLAPSEYRALPVATAAGHGASIQKDAIAIIGMSGRFAESESLDEFWQHLKEGDDLVGDVTRWPGSACTTSASVRPDYCSKGSFVASIDCFDPLFFKISPVEATYMDPQQRLFLEESWKALEDAGYAGKGMDGKECGVYVGSKGSDYDRLFQEEPVEQAFWGNAGSVIPARIAYYLNLHGPAVAVDTACSSALVAMHQACQGLWSGEIEMALAGGVFLQSTPEFYQLCNRAGMLSPQGKCHAFDARANGFVLGEGVGVVVMKRLEEALKDGDTIHGVIIASGLNQDGATNGITAPSSKSQEALECAVYDRFHIDPATIQLVEAHGTGTKLGDPIEYGALQRSFGRYTEEKQFCAIGSVKTNIGHAVTAAGVAGVLKLLLALKHRQIPPSLHFKEGNPAIDFESSPFYVNTALQDWEKGHNHKRRAAISSFGFSGTNAHLVIEEAPVVAATEISLPAYLVVLSALSTGQLQQQAQNLCNYLKNTPDVSMNNLSYTLFEGRRHMNHRIACVAGNRDELLRNLEQWLEKGKAPQVFQSEIQEGDVREQPSLKEYANQRIRQCVSTTVDPARCREDLAIIAEFYGKGYALDYHRLFAPASKRISLPTYPFAREHYWVDASAAVTDRMLQKTAAGKAAGRLHPLIHLNTSDFDQQRYSSFFNGEEFFLKDHQLQLQESSGIKVLPGVAYLEMIRAAIELASPRQVEERILELRDIVWLSPVIVRDPMELSIALSQTYGRSSDESIIEYEIYSENKESKEEAAERIHCQGHAHFSQEPSPGKYAISQLQGRMNNGVRDAASLYSIFSKMGFAYGPSHQGLTSLMWGEGELLADLSLPSVMNSANEHGRLDGFVLHPSLMDSALQASIGLLVDMDHPPENPSVPFNLECLRIVAACTEEMYAWIRYAKGCKPGDRVMRLDIDILDNEGNICVQIEGCSSRLLERGIAPDRQQAAHTSDFDDAYYQAMIERVLNNEVSVDEAVELE